MAIAVVDRLESIEIDQNQRARRFGLEQLLHLGDKRAAIEQAGEAVFSRRSRSAGALCGQRLHLPHAFVQVNWNRDTPKNHEHDKGPVGLDEVRDDEAQCGDHGARHEYAKSLRVHRGIDASGGDVAREDHAQDVPGWILARETTRQPRQSGQVQCSSGCDDVEELGTPDPGNGDVRSSGQRQNAKHDFDDDEDCQADLSHVVEPQRHGHRCERVE